MLNFHTMTHLNSVLVLGRITVLALVKFLIQVLYLFNIYMYLMLPKTSVGQHGC